MSEPTPSQLARAREIAEQLRGWTGVIFSDPPEAERIIARALADEAQQAEQAVNWKASYHQACDDADAYKADAERRIADAEQRGRQQGIQDSIARLRRLSRVASGPASSWIMQCIVLLRELAKEGPNR